MSASPKPGPEDASRAGLLENPQVCAGGAKNWDRRLGVFRGFCWLKEEAEGGLV